MVLAGKKGDADTAPLEVARPMGARKRDGTPKQVGVVDVPGMLPIIRRNEHSGSLANPEA